MDLLFEKIESYKRKWNDSYDKVAALAKGKILYITRPLPCFYKTAPQTYVITKLVKIEIAPLSGNLKFTLRTANEDKEYIVLVSRSFEGKSFDKIRNIEVTMLKILDLFGNKNDNKKNDELEMIASESL